MNNVRRRRKLESPVSETVRIASIVQKGVSAGRSSYVEMRALARQTAQNVRSKVRAILAAMKDNSNDAGNDNESVLRTLASDISEGYTDVITPNGAIRQDKLDGLLEIDGEIATCLGIIEAELVEKKTAKGFATLGELVQERKKFVDGLRA
jgi:hypothetical protein